MDGAHNGKPLLDLIRMDDLGGFPLFSETSIFIHSQFNSSSHFTLKYFWVILGTSPRAPLKLLKLQKRFFCCPKKKEQPPKNPTNQAQPPTNPTQPMTHPWDWYNYTFTHIYHRFMPNLGTLN